MSWFYHYVYPWFTRWWWQILLAPRHYDDVPWHSVIWCRIRNHPCGVWWFNPHGYEPDMRCKNCGDDLG